MRLRNIPRADRILSEHQKVIKNEAEKKGKWSMVFENEHPVYVDANCIDMIQSHRGFSLRKAA